MKHLNAISHLARPFVAVLALLSSTCALADNISGDQALQLARQFVTHRAPASGQRHAPAATQQVTPAGQVSGLYVFNVGSDGGFVIVSNDDRTTPVLGFSDSGHLDTQNIPSNMRAWLQGYADEIAWLQKQEVQLTPSVRKAPKAKRAPQLIDNHVAVAPMLQTTWSQNRPYNDQTPYYKQEAADGPVTYSKDYVDGYQHCVTGCVATAMAQVMKYHQWPTGQTTNIPAYTWPSAGIGLDGLSPVTFSWSNMLNSYAGSYTTAQSEAVSTLMKYCGWSVGMDYGPSSGSNTEAVATALVQYFGYNSSTTQTVARTFYTYADWMALIYHEVYNGRPVVYGGQSSGGGHEFVCDGYKYENATDFFHINWGWGGLSDDYFVLSVLKPNLEGIGGSSTNDGYRSGQDAVIGIQKPNESGTVADIAQKEINLVLNSMTLDQTTVYLGSSVNVTLNVTNNSNDEYFGEVYVGSWEALLVGDNCQIPAGETQDIVLTFTPSAVGIYDLVFYLPAVNGGYGSVGGTRATLTVIASGAPTDLAVSEIKGHSAVLSWTDNYNASSWVVAYAAEGATGFSEVSAPSNPFMLTGLTGETKYTVKVRPANGADKWSQEITFTTDIACASPQELAVSDVTHNAAVASWTGYADSYEVRYGLMPQDFTSTTATWLQYDNGQINAVYGFGMDETTWGVMYPGNKVAGNLLTKVSIFEITGYNSEDITVNIYSGGDNAPGQLVHTLTVTPEANNAFHEIVFDQPVAITPGKNLWITLTEKGTYPLDYCEQDNNDPNSQWIMYGGNWYILNDITGDDLSRVCWMIRGYVESESLNPDIVDWTTATCSDHSYMLTDLETATDYVVQVRGNYDGEGSSQWETLMFTTRQNVSLADAATNNTAGIESYYESGEMVSVTLSGRTLYKDGAWNTICLPFDLVLKGSPLEDATAKTLADATMTGTHVTLTFGDAVSKLQAGVPYIIKWEEGEDIEEPTFTNVTVTATEGQSIEKAGGNVQFIGYYDAFGITAADEDIYYMTAGNTLKHTAKDRQLKALRAYFRFTEAAAARSFVLDFGDGDVTTAISSIDTDARHRGSEWYSLDGMKHSQQPAQKGVYVKDGKKIVVK